MRRDMSATLARRLSATRTDTSPAAVRAAFYRQHGAPPASPEPPSLAELTAILAACLRPDGSARLGYRYRVRAIRVAIATHPDRAPTSVKPEQNPII